MEQYQNGRGSTWCLCNHFKPYSVKIRSHSLDKVVRTKRFHPPTIRLSLQIWLGQGSCRLSNKLRSPAHKYSFRRAFQWWNFPCAACNIPREFNVSSLLQSVFEIAQNVRFSWATSVACTRIGTKVVKDRVLSVPVILRGWWLESVHIY